MLYLLAIFVPPIYFLTQKKWLAAAVTGFLFLVSAVTWLTIPVLWPVCSICAVWDLRKVLMKEHAEIMAKKMAETMRQGQPPVHR